MKKTPDRSDAPRRPVEESATDRRGPAGAPSPSPRYTVDSMPCGMTASPGQRSGLDRVLVQLRRAVSAAAGSHDRAAAVHAAAARGVSGGGGTLPHLEQIQRSFGAHDVGDVKARVGGPAREASEALGARAYATGSNVAFREAPDLHTAAHEAAHVVQQRAGVSLKSGVGEAGDRYEQHADAVADEVVAGRSAERILGRFAGQSTTPGAAAAGVQLRPRREYERTDEGRRCTGGTETIVVPASLDVLRERLTEMVGWMTERERAPDLVALNGSLATAWEDGLSDRAGQTISVRASLHWNGAQVDSVDFDFDVRNTSLDMEPESVRGRPGNREEPSGRREDSRETARTVRRPTSIITIRIGPRMEGPPDRYVLVGQSYEDVPATHDFPVHEGRSGFAQISIWPLEQVWIDTVRWRARTPGDTASRGAVIALDLLLGALGGDVGAASEHSNGGLPSMSPPNISYDSWQAFEADEPRMAAEVRAHLSE